MPPRAGQSSALGKLNAAPVAIKPKTRGSNRLASNASATPLVALGIALPPAKSTALCSPPAKSGNTTVWRPKENQYVWVRIEKEGWFPGRITECKPKASYFRYRSFSPQLATCNIPASLGSTELHYQQLNILNFEQDKKFKALQDPALKSSKVLKQKATAAIKWLQSEREANKYYPSMVNTPGNEEDSDEFDQEWRIDDPGFPSKPLSANSTFRMSKIKKGPETLPRRTDNPYSSRGNNKKCPAVPTTPKSRSVFYVDTVPKSNSRSISCSPLSDTFSSGDETTFTNLENDREHDSKGSIKAKQTSSASASQAKKKKRELKLKVKSISFNKRPRTDDDYQLDTNDLSTVLTPPVLPSNTSSDEEDIPMADASVRLGDSVLAREPQSKVYLPARLVKYDSDNGTWDVHFFTGTTAHSIPRSNICVFGDSQFAYVPLGDVSAVMHQRLPNPKYRNHVLETRVQSIFPALDGILRNERPSWRLEQFRSGGRRAEHQLASAAGGNPYSIDEYSLLFRILLARYLEPTNTIGDTRDTPSQYLTHIGSFSENACQSSSLPPSNISSREKFNSLPFYQSPIVLSGSDTEENDTKCRSDVSVDLFTTRPLQTPRSCPTISPLVIDLCTPDEPNRPTTQNQNLINNSSYREFSLSPPPQPPSPPLQATGRQWNRPNKDSRLISANELFAPGPADLRTHNPRLIELVLMPECLLRMIILTHGVGTTDSDAAIPAHKACLGLDSSPASTSSGFVGSGYATEDNQTNSLQSNPAHLTSNMWNAVRRYVFDSEMYNPPFDQPGAGYVLSPRDEARLLSEAENLLRDCHWVAGLLQLRRSATNQQRK